MNSFDFNTAPASSFTLPLVVVPIWLIVIYSIQYHINHNRKGKPIQCNTLFAYHNLLMSIISAIMFVGCAVEVYLRITGSLSYSHHHDGDHNVRWLVCEPSGTRPVGRLYFWSYIYYLSKYYELFDTVFLALKGKLVGWGGLNVYHHAIVVFMAWWWCSQVQTLQFIGLLFNTSVHIIMYYYFYLRSLNKKANFRNFITFYQILQFTTSFCIFPYNLYLHFNVVKNGCSGEFVLILNLIFNLTLLAEFVDILKVSLGWKKKEKKEKGEGKAGKGESDESEPRVEKSQARVGRDGGSPTLSDGEYDNSNLKEIAEEQLRRRK